MQTAVLGRRPDRLGSRRQEDDVPSRSMPVSGNGSAGAERRRAIDGGKVPGDDQQGQAVQQYSAEGPAILRSASHPASREITGQPINVAVQLRRRTILTSAGLAQHAVRRLGLANSVRQRWIPVTATVWDGVEHKPQRIHLQGKVGPPARLFASIKRSIGERAVNAIETRWRMSAILWSKPGIRSAPLHLAEGPVEVQRRSPVCVATRSLRRATAAAPPGTRRFRWHVESGSSRRVRRRGSVRIVRTSYVIRHM